MSPSHHAPGRSPRASRLALFVYAVSGVIGVLGVFAAVQPGQPIGDLIRKDPVVVVVDEPVLDGPVQLDSASVDARTLVGVWRNGGDVVVLDALGFGATCVSGLPTKFAWSMRGSDVLLADGRVLGVAQYGGKLEVDGRLFHAVQDGGAL
ncbi:MAG: hypothetical protein Q8O67_29345 [Deltaproteobacteria bacterium]|nr:hypothetical protein [Deltaproteobacteria bacterium]